MWKAALPAIIPLRSISSQWQHACQLLCCSQLQEQVYRHCVQQMVKGCFAGHTTALHAVTSLHNGSMHVDCCVAGNCRNKCTGIVCSRSSKAALLATMPRSLHTDRQGLARPIPWARVVRLLGQKRRSRESRLESSGEHHAVHAL